MSPQVCLRRQIRIQKVPVVPDRTIRTAKTRQVSYAGVCRREKRLRRLYHPLLQAGHPRSGQGGDALRRPTHDPQASRACQLAFVRWSSKMTGRMRRHGGHLARSGGERSWPSTDRSGRGTCPGFADFLELLLAQDFHPKGLDML